MLFCVVNKKEIVMLKEKVDEIDPEAFVIVTDAREVHGEGFIEKSNTKKYIKNCKFFSLSSFIFGKYILKYNTGIRFYS